MRSSRSCLLLLSLFLFTTCHTSLAQSKNRFFDWTKGDAPGLLRSIDGRSLAYGAGGIALISALSLADRTVQSRAKLGASGLWDAYGDAANLLGEPVMAIPTTLGLFGVSLLTRNARFQDAAFTSLESLLYASATTFALKLIIGRLRPEDASSPYDFSPLSSRDSFPSGHTTAAMAMLVPWAMYYPNFATWGLVIVAGGGTGFARVTRNKHWLTDVTMGGMIGFLTGVLLSRRHKAAQQTNAFKSSQVQCSPVILPGQRGVLFTFSI